MYQGVPAAKIGLLYGWLVTTVHPFPLFAVFSYVTLYIVWSWPTYFVNFAFAFRIVDALGQLANLGSSSLSGQFLDFDLRS